MKFVCFIMNQSTVCLANCFVSLVGFVVYTEASE